MKNNYKMIFVAVALLIVVGIAVAAISNHKGSQIASNAANSGSNKVSEYSGNVQEATISVLGSSYVLTPSTFVKGVPVRIKPDIAHMPGCSKSVVIPDFNVRKSVYSTSDVIEFTPDKTGTFNFMCSMNMYRGQFTVVESQGSGTASVESPSAVKPVATQATAQLQDSGSAPSCNMGSGAASGSKPSGGCGCGMMQ